MSQKLKMVLVLFLLTLLPALALAGTGNVLFVVTSANQLPNGKQTGIWLEEYAVPYQKLTSAGYRVVVASPNGGQAPLDPGSLKHKEASWAAAEAELKTTLPLANVSADDYVAIYLPGGHGTMFDFPQNRPLKALLHNFSVQDKIIAAVCHGPAGFIGATKADGTPLVAGKTMTSFTNAEETAVKLDSLVPFPLETKLRAEGGQFVAGPNWGSHVEVDGKLVTGQNPASSAAVAEAMLKLL